LQFVIIHSFYFLHLLSDNIRSKALAKALFSFFVLSSFLLSSPFMLLLLLFYTISIFQPPSSSDEHWKFSFVFIRRLCTFYWMHACQYILFVKFIIHHVGSTSKVRTVACILRHYDVIYGWNKIKWCIYWFLIFLELICF
jgi:hypothetical protein